MTPLHKKGRKDAKQKYRPVSILPTLSRIYERSMFKQMSSYLEDKFSKHPCGFRKGFSTQQCLLPLLEKWKNAVDKGKMFGALLADLSKTFDCLTMNFEFAKSRAISAIRASVVYLPTCQRAKSVPSSHFYVPTCQ